MNQNYEYGSFETRNMAMYSPPYIFFHFWHSMIAPWSNGQPAKSTFEPNTCFARGLAVGRWGDRTDPALHQLATLNDCPPSQLPSLTINVSQPDSLLAWLEVNSAALVTDLHIFVDAPYDSPSAQEWCLLFYILAKEATNLRRLQVYWDHGDPIFHTGLGKSLAFLRGLAKLRPKKSVEIAGFYARHWPAYLERELGLRPVNNDAVPGSNWAKIPGRYQQGTDMLIP